MAFRWDPKEHLSVAVHTLKWTALSLPLAVLTGSAVALFLWALDLATRTRLEQPWLIWLLPAAGALIVWAYRRYGGKSDQGNNLVIDEIHKPSGGVPLRMAPFILVSTVLTHLFGGSAGREGTAVQMGGSLASSLGRFFRLQPDTVRLLTMAGVAAGFAAVFGTPLAGTVFAMEVLSLGTLRYEAVLPCLASAVLADRICVLWGIHHTDYHLGLFASVERLQPLTGEICVKVALAAAAFGLAAFLFAEATHSLGALAKKHIQRDWLRPVVGGLLVLGLAAALGTRDYLGLGVSNPTNGISILSSFQIHGANAFSWFWKLLFTAITLGSGFKGGEVTPLFFVGAALGNSLAVLLNAPVDLFAGLGFVAVFAAATNTPLACTLMGIELFGGAYTLHLALACFIAYLFSGHSSIYLSQRLGVAKGGLKGKSAATMRSLRDERDGVVEI